MNDSSEDELSFTVSFVFHSGRPFFRGIPYETVVSHRVGAKYRVLAIHPKDGKMHFLKGLEEPLSQKELNNALEKIIPFTADTFAFEVFDSGGNRIFSTKFDALSKMPAGLKNDQATYQNFSWAFELPKQLKAPSKD